MLKLIDYHFNLPAELIAQYPLAERDASRLMVLHDQEIEHKTFKDLDLYLEKGDVVVFNDTRVIPARLYGHKLMTFGKVEFLWLKNESQGVWRGILKPARSIREGMKIQFGNKNEIAAIEKHLDDGQVLLKWCGDTDPDQFLHLCGHMPIPPYILSKEPVP